MLFLYFYGVLHGILILDAVLPLKESTPVAVLARVFLQICSKKFSVPKALKSLFLHLYSLHHANTLLLA